MFLEQILNMSGGYVLEFSDATFADFVRASTGQDIYSEGYSANGHSKAKRLRAFWDRADDSAIASLLGDLLALMIDNDRVTVDGKEARRIRRIVQQLRQGHEDEPRAERVDKGELRAFVSYSVAKKEAGAAVKKCLTRFGYDCFLAHQDLRVSEEWKHRIIDELGEAHVFVAILSQEFRESDWCGQEIGFIVSRPETLVVPLSVDGTMPYGFIGHLQGIKVDGRNLDAVLEEVLYRKRPRHVIPAQIERIRDSRSWRDSVELMRPLVPHFAAFTKTEVNSLAEAAASNGEVWDAGLCRNEYIPEFVRINGTRISTDAAKRLKAVIAGLDFPQAQ